MDKIKSYDKQKRVSPPDSDGTPTTRLPMIGTCSSMLTGTWTRITAAARPGGCPAAAAAAVTVSPRRKKDGTL